MDRAAYVLIVDDHKLRRQWTKRALTGGQLRVYSASSAQQCLRYLRQVQFDIVVIAEHLRGMGVRQLQATIHRLYPNVPTVVVFFEWPAGKDVTELSPGGYHCLLLCAQDREEALRSKVVEALAFSTGTEAKDEGEASSAHPSGGP